MTDILYDIAHALPEPYYEFSFWILLAILLGLQFLLSSLKPRWLGIIIPCTFLIVYAIPGIFFAAFPTDMAPCSIILSYLLAIFPIHLTAFILVGEWHYCRRRKKSEKTKSFWKDKLVITVLILMIVQAFPTMYNVAKYNHAVSEFNNSIIDGRKNAKKESESLIKSHSDSLKIIFRYAKDNDENPFVTQPEELKDELSELQEVIGKPTIRYRKDKTEYFILRYSQYGGGPLMPDFVGISWNAETDTLSIQNYTYFYSEFENEF